MKYIYGMIQDGTSTLFVDAYNHAKINNELGFTYDYKYYDMIKARAMVILITQEEKKYEEYIDSQAEHHFEWQAEIARGK